MVRMLVGVAAVSLGIASSAAVVAQDAQQPLKSGVELVLVDAQVVDRTGAPIAGLTADKFEVKIGGKRRKIASIEFLEARTGLPPGDGNGRKPINEPGTIYVLAIDQGSFRPVNAPAAMHAVREFLKRTNPNDYVGIVSFPSPGTVIHPTRDRAPLEAAIPGIVGFSQLKQQRQYQFSLADAIDVSTPGIGKDPEVFNRVMQRNCPPGDMTCPPALEMEMAETVSMLEMQAARSLAGLR